MSTNAVIAAAAVVSGTIQRSESHAGRSVADGGGLVFAIAARTARHRSQSAACVSAAAR
jgi:hypothetical protein